MDIDPDQIWRLTALAVFAVSAIDLGVAFLMRGSKDAAPETSGRD